MREHIEKTSISITRLNMPLMLVVSAIIAAGSAWGVASVARYKLDDTVKDVEALKANQLPAALKMQHVEDKVDAMGEALERIEKHLGTK